MKSRGKLTVRGFVSAVTIAAATPMAVHAGSMTIYNENCTKFTGLKTRKRVTVLIDSSKNNEGCTDTYVTVSKHKSKTVELAANGIDGDSCGKYSHEARGTAFGKYDAPGNKHTRVTCKKDWADVCQCTKD